MRSFSSKQDGMRTLWGQHGLWWKCRSLHDPFAYFLASEQKYSARSIVLVVGSGVMRRHIHRRRRRAASLTNIILFNSFLQVQNFTRQNQSTSYLTSSITLVPVCVNFLKRELLCYEQKIIIYTKSKSFIIENSFKYILGKLCFLKNNNKC